jgi:uncharacterized UBP type Zn finger protein
MPDLCEHLTNIELPEPATPNGCDECLAMGSRWVHLRLCVTCGKVSCCDSSPNQHASKHVTSAGHPAVASLEPHEDWAYCYTDDLYLEEI